MEKRTPESLLRSLEAKSSDEDEDVESAPSMSEKEVKAELLASGDTHEGLEKMTEASPAALEVTPADVETKPAASENEAKRRDSSRVAPMPPRFTRRFWGTAAALAAAFAALVGFAEVSGLFGPEIVTGAGNDTPSNPEAEAIRTQAADAFEVGDWNRCLILLDQAKAKDPKGDESVGVKDMRRIAMRKLGALDASPP